MNTIRTLFTTTLLLLSTTVSANNDWPPNPDRGKSSSGAFANSHTTPEAKKTFALSKIQFLLSMLQVPGANGTDKFQPKQFKTDSIGMDFSIPDTKFSASTFYSRPNIGGSTENWHVALAYDEAQLKTRSPLSDHYGQLTDVIGIPRYKSLVVVVSEDAGNVHINSFPTSLKNALMPFKNSGFTDALMKNKVSFAKGVNVFTSIEAPEKGAFKTLEGALLMGGTATGNVLHINGSVGYDLLGKLMADEKAKVSVDEAKQAAAQKAADDARNKDNNKPIPAVALKLSFPSVIPAPFSFMEAAEAKKSFYMEIAKTSVGIKYNQAEKSFALNAQQAVNLWVNNKAFTTNRDVSFSKDTTDASGKTYVLAAKGAVGGINWKLVDGFTLQDISLAGSTKIVLDKSNRQATTATQDNTEEGVWQTGAVNEGTTRNGGIRIGGHRNSWQSGTINRDATRSDIKIGEHRRQKKTTDLKFVLGVKVKSTAVGDLSGALGLTVRKATGKKVRLKEIFLQFDGDKKAEGLALNKIKALKKIPVAKDFKISGLGIGISPPEKGVSKLGFHLYGGLEWTKPGIKGQFAVLKIGKDFHVMGRMTDFSIAKVVGAMPKKTRDKLSIFKDPMNAFQMPNAMVVFSTAAGDANNGGALTLNDLPFQIQTLFNGIVKDPNTKVPLYGEGISMIGAVDLSKDKNLSESISALGIDISEPVLLSGSIGGFQSGKIKVAFYLGIPKVELPDDQSLSDVVHAKSGGGKFFISVDTTPTFKVGLSADFAMHLPRVAGTKKGADIVNMGGDVYVNVEATGVGARFAGYTIGDWRDPLGFEGITLKNTAVIIGADADGALELGLGTSLSFALQSAKKPIKSAKIKSPKDLFKRLKTLETQLVDAENTQPKEVSVSSGLVVNVNFAASGIPIPKKIGFVFKNDELSIPNVLDIFDLFLKGLMTAPAANELVKAMPSGSVQRKILSELRKGFKQGNWIPPSQKIALVSPVPLDAIFLRDIELYFATPGAVLPGFKDLDGNIGLKLKGALWITDLADGSKQEVGAANIDLTLQGIDFGAIAEDMENTYLDIASVTIDPLKAERNCPAGSFFDAGLSSCWSCPKNYDRTVAAVTADNACKQVTVSQKKAKFIKKVVTPASCSKEAFYDPRNHGECWSCPRGYTRNAKSVTDKAACTQLLDATFKKAKRHGKATGLLGTDCKAGQFWDPNGNCYSCPAGTIRNPLQSITHKEACAVLKVAAKTAKATLKVEGGKPKTKNSFLDIGRGEWWSCPQGYRRTVFAVKSGEACEKVTVKFAKGTSVPRGQIRSDSERCFGAKGGKLATGVNVVMQTCSKTDSRSQSWYIDSQKRLRPLQQLSLTQGALCLDINEKSKSVYLNRCAPSSNKTGQKKQKWYVTKENRIRSSYNQQCLNFKRKKQDLEVANCIKSKNQLWNFGPTLVKAKPVKEDKGRRLQITSFARPHLCLSVSDKKGAKAKLAKCDGGKDQQWFFSNLGLIHTAAGKYCLSSSKNKQKGVDAFVTKCSLKQSSQKWQQSADLRLQSVDGQCLDYKSGKTEGLDATARMNKCIDSDNQKWSLLSAPKKAPTN